MDFFTIDGTTITFEDNPDPQVYNNSDELQEYINDIRDAMKRFIKNANANTQSKTLYTQVVNYENYLDTLDTSTITFPINTWEKYCEDNGITYLNLLQIP